MVLNLNWLFHLVTIYLFIYFKQFHFRLKREKKMSLRSGTKQSSSYVVGDFTKTVSEDARDYQTDLRQQG